MAGMVVVVGSTGGGGKMGDSLAADCVLVGQGETGVNVAVGLGRGVGLMYLPVGVGNGDGNGESA